MENKIIKFCSIITCATLVFYSMLLPLPAKAAGCCKFEPTEEQLKESMPGGCAPYVAGGAALGLIGGAAVGWITCQGVEWRTKICEDAERKEDCEAKGGEFDKEACNNISTIRCLAYTPKKYEAEGKAVGEVKLLNPVCWPKEECDYRCRAGADKCWGEIQPRECPPDYHYCYSEPAPTQLQVPIAGIGVIRDMGSYIALLYNYLIGVAVIVAIVMIMYGGFRWITAAGSPEKIGQAKSTIVSAIVGLLLALFSYTLLNTINPALVRLEMPRIKMIRGIVYEKQIVRCSDYSTETECTNNPKGVDLDKGGCEWRVVGGFGEQCSTKAPQPGESGNLCPCNEGLNCIEGIRYNLGPLAANYTQPKNWCSDGERDSPCNEDSDCKSGLLCDDNIKACVQEDCCRPELAKCDDHKECSSLLCENGKCARGDELRNCGISADPLEGGTDEKCGDGYKCETFGQKEVYQSWEKWICCPKNQPRWKCNAQCRQDSECGALPNEQDEFCWQNEQVWLKNSTTGEENTTGTIRELNGHCVELRDSGDVCVVNAECKSGSCGNGTYYFYTSPKVQSLFPGLEYDPKYDGIWVGTCD